MLVGDNTNKGGEGGEGGRARGAGQVRGAERRCWKAQVFVGDNTNKGDKQSKNAITQTIPEKFIPPLNLKHLNLNHKKATHCLFFYVIN